ncbi:MAG: hypothetical protein U1E65_07140 [Myxococcota bacterium]
MRRILDALGLWLCLAVLAAVPVLELVAVGLLFEREGRIARGEGLWSALALSPRVRRGIATVLGVSLVFLPIALFRAVLRDATVASEAIPRAGQLALLIAGAMAGAHAWMAALDGRFVAFLRPLSSLRRIRRGSGDLGPRISLQDLLGALNRAARLALSGLVSLVGSALWFVPAAAAIAVRIDTPLAVLVVLLGAIACFLVVGWLPFLQAHAAAEERLSAFLELSAVRSRARRAPLAHLLALLGWVLAAMPLYAFQIFALPSEARTTVAVITIALLLPARFLAAWAYARGGRAAADAPKGVWAMAALLRAPLAFVIVLASLLLPYVAAHGPAAVLESAAFLLPLPR